MYHQRGDRGNAKMDFHHISYGSPLRNMGVHKARMSMEITLPALLTECEICISWQFCNNTKIRCIIKEEKRRRQGYVRSGQLTKKGKTTLKTNAQIPKLCKANVIAPAPPIMVAVFFTKAIFLKS